MIDLRFLCKTINNKGITTIIPIVVMLVLFTIACSGEPKENVEVEFDPETTYTLKTTDVVSLISDSGITRYRIIAQEWYNFDKAKEPYSYFPEGFYVERFDSLFVVEASVKSDTAYYYSKLSLWKLVGNVEVENINGEFFETSLLFWDQKEEKIYSDKFIRIKQVNDKIITGIGFESNQDMTKYRIFNSKGEFPMSETANDTPADSTRTSPSIPSPVVRQPQVTDSLQTEPLVEEIVQTE